MTEQPLGVGPNEHRQAVRVRSRIPPLADPAQLDHGHGDALGQRVDREPRRGVRRGALHAEAHAASPIRVGGDGHDEFAAAMSDLLELWAVRHRIERSTSRAGLTNDDKKARRRAFDERAYRGPAPLPGIFSPHSRRRRAEDLLRGRARERLIVTSSAGVSYLRKRSLEKRNCKKSLEKIRRQVNGSGNLSAIS